MKIEGKEYLTIWFDDNSQTVKIIDQTKLPHQFIIKDLKTVKEAINAIKIILFLGSLILKSLINLTFLLINPLSVMLSLFPA